MVEPNGKFAFDVIDVHTHVGRLPGHVHYAYSLARYWPRTSDSPIVSEP